MSELDDFFPDEGPTTYQAELDKIEQESESDEADAFDPDGAGFSGDLGTSLPTSVVNYRRRTRTRTELDRLSSEYARHAREVQEAAGPSRRSSVASSRPPLEHQNSALSVESATVLSSDEDEGHRPGAKRRKPLRRNKSMDDRSIVSRRSSRSIGSVAARLRGRSGSMGSRAADEEESDRSETKSIESVSDYGPYGDSGSSNASTHSGSEGGRTRTTNGFFVSHGLLGARDPFFGDSRIDMPFPDLSDDGRDWPEDKGRNLTASQRLPGHSQSLYLVDEDLQVLFLGWKSSLFKNLLWYFGALLTLGTLPLLARWFPALWIKGKGAFCPFSSATHIIAKTNSGDQHIVRLEHQKLDSPLLQHQLFPPNLRPPPTNRDAFYDANQKPFANGLKTATGLVEELKVVEFRHYRFVLHPETSRWYMLRDWRDPTWTTVDSLRAGISPETQAQRLALFGGNLIKIQVKSVAQLLVDECLHPFCALPLSSLIPLVEAYFSSDVFQVASIILWSLDDYMFYAATIAIISVISIITTLVETKRNTRRMVEMSRFYCPVHVQRNHEWQLLSSEDLVPGDVVDLAHGDLVTFPADILLLSGDAIVNESMLTGESVPVSKWPIEDDELPQLLSSDDVSAALAKNIVFNGTRVVRVKRTDVASGQQEAVGLVLRTGFNTTKGALVRSMLFPRPLGFKFYRDSFRFIGILSLIAAIGFLGSVAKFIEFGISWGTIVKRALDLITITCPPALPATMSIGTSFAISRLRKAMIYCISPSRVNVGGKVDVWVFDKTGTLTEEGLDVLGVRNVDRISGSFSELFPGVDDIPVIGVEDAKTPMLHALATCHSLKLVDGQLMGDPLDLRMFEFTHWSLEEGQDAPRPSEDLSRDLSHDHRVPERRSTLVQMVVRPPGGQRFNVSDALRAGKKHAHFLEVGIIRTFDFVSSLRRMAVMTKKLKSKSIEVYVKGAPEVMVDICDKASLPEDFDELLTSYTRHGFRVIAFAAKSIPGLTWIKAQRMKREQVESGLRFLGFIVFENRLKIETAPVIHSLKSARIGTRMCTGDNIRTAVSVARECGMVREQARVYIPRFVKGDQNDARAEVEWAEVDDDELRLDNYSLEPLATDDDTSSLESRDWGIAVSGDVFRWVIDYAPLETLQRVGSHLSRQGVLTHMYLRYQMLVKTTVFARMSPDEKHELVDRLQSLSYTVGFCGDGANDCGALKAADVGLSLSEAEASVAAPFTSRRTDISCTLEVIREGRAALVTSFSCFKYMALYSLIQFTSVTLLYSIASSMGDFQFLYIDLFIILPIAVTMGRAKPYPRINPKRPTANLVSKQVLVSLLGQILLTSGFQLFVFFYIRSQPWYIEPKINPIKLKIKNYENTALFLISSFQYIFVAAIFCVGPPYRQPVHTNTLFLLTLVALGTFSLYTLFVTGGPVFKLLQLIHLPREFHLELSLLVVANIVLSYLFEKHLVFPLAKGAGRALKRWRAYRGKSRKSSGKLYKAIG